MIKTSFKQILAAGLMATTLLFGAAALPGGEVRADSLREVAERVARQNDARVVSAREVERNGRRFYEIRIMTRDGVVKTIRVPADDRRRDR
ncbi:hypothetical protein HFP89_02920 [Wenzhouxiangella sp. XN79A]|uniref:PepSY domain-containing protein n=1 Tax=Wenzhouxiangella sp. XN79A TaxID=2724193 RepID=UPI00144A9923|nr:hypothetical protein [Wenzhouxiangella sp. XN79A]NKI34117.1 hypothetical protein [Wenzhouxiangella sp. XN79A]